MTTSAGHRRARLRSRVWHKLALIGLAFTLPLATSTYLLVTENGQHIEFGESEQRGLDFLRPLSALLLDLSAHKALARQVPAGQRPGADLEATEVRIDAAFAELLEVDARLGGALRTTSADLNEVALPATQAGNWRTWQAGPRDLTSSDAAHAAMIRDVRTLISYVGVTSNLVLDPELSTYHLADALVVRAPELVDRIRQLGDSVEELVAGGRISLPDRTSVATAAGMLALHADQLQEDLFRTFRDDAGSRATQETLGPLLQSAYLAITNLSTTTTRDFVEASPVVLDQAAFRDAVDAAVDATATLWTALVAQERLLLQARIDDDMTYRTSALTAVLAALALTVLLMVWQSRRITKDVGTVSRVATALADGDLTRRARVRSRDEIGALATAFNGMAERLQEMVEDQRAAEHDLREAKERFQQAFDNASIGMCLVDLDTRFTQVNLALCEMLGRSRDQLLTLSFTDVTHPEDVAASQAAANRMKSGDSRPYCAEKRYLRPDGGVVWTLLTVCVVHSEDGEPLYFVTQVEDITERREAEARLVHQALHDPLTGLPNRTLFMDRLRQVLARTSRHPMMTAILFIDLDGFKDVNDSLGHEVGDEVLREISLRLQDHVRPFDTVARLGGDEFVVLCQDLVKEQDVLEISGRLVDSLTRPVVVGSYEVVVTASVGIALADGNAPTPEALLRDADTAMYGAKARGKNRCEIFDEELRARSVDRIAIASALRQGLRDNNFVLHFQPVIDLATGTPVAVESLVRLNDPDKGLLAPGTFIQVAEDSGLIVPIGTSVLGQACRQLAAWRASGEVAPGLRATVNVSGRQATRPDLADTIRRALAEAGLEPGALALELTETVLMEADAGTLRQLEQIREFGVELGIDDFGTGYSSLSYLKRLPVSFVKVDRSFVAGLVTDPSDREIVTTVIRLGQALGLTTIAEGVEHVDQFELLRELGCDQAQGFLLGRPQPGPPASGLLAGLR